MTKRFMLDDAGELIDLNNHKFIDYGEECCNLLNEQHETIERLKQNIDELLSVDIEEELLKENEQLKQQLSDVRKENYGNLDGLNYYQEQNGHLSSKISDLECENEQLKQFKEYVFNKIDMHLRMLPTARDNEFNEYDGDPSLYTGAIYMLETLKKELKE